MDHLGGGVATLGTPEPQLGEALYAAKIDRSELELVWERPAVELGRVVRVGRAWTTFRGRRLIVERARVVPGPSGGGAPPTVALATGGLRVSGTAPVGLPAVGGSPPGTLVGDEVVCGDGRLELVEVRPEGRAPQSFASWRRGARPEEGERLGA